LEGCGTDREILLKWNLNICVFQGVAVILAPVNDTGWQECPFFYTRLISRIKQQNLKFWDEINKYINREFKQLFATWEVLKYLYSHKFNHKLFYMPYNN